MEYRELGNTGLKLPVLSFGASSLGQEFRQIDISEALRAVAHIERFVTHAERHAICQERVDVKSAQKQLI